MTDVDTRASTEVHFSVLGPLAASAGGSPIELGAPKQKALLAMFLAQANEQIPVGRIITGLWGEDAPDTYRKSIYTYVSNLRALLDVDLTRVGDGYRLGIEPEQLDAEVFEQAVERERSLLATEPVQAAERLRTALRMWRGHPYADVSDLEFLQGEIRRLEELRLGAVELRIEADLASGRHREVVGEVGALAEEHLLRERFRAQHMVALYRSGRQGDALRAFERTREYLSEEMGLEPSQELQDLELSILQHDESLTQGASGATTQRVALMAVRMNGYVWEEEPGVAAHDVSAYEGAVRSAIDSSGGTVFRQGGEDMAAAFRDLATAIAAAEAAQRSLNEIEWEASEGLSAGIGIDVGEAESRGGAFFGPPVNRASRLASAAHGQQVLLSAAAQRGVAAASPSGVQVRQLGEGQLKGFPATERIAQLVVDGLRSDFPELRLDRDPVGDSLWHLSPPGYELREQIGRGRFGTVFRAYQPAMGREVAIKIIDSRFADHSQFIQRFEAEARKVARLVHPHIVPLLDYWRGFEGAYLVMPYLTGGSLGDMLGEGVDQSKAAQILHQVASALDYAHGEGLAHGALSPSNVLFDSSGNAYVGDFAIAARLLDPEVISAVRDQSEFRAPEEATSGPSRAADQYSLGVLASRLLSDPEADWVMARATADRPSDRYSDVRSLMVAFNRALGLTEMDLEPPAVARNPYKGLRAFDEADHSDFYGRDELVANMADAVTRHRFVCVVGPSGSGKSSAVRAGLIPSLESGAITGSNGWLSVTFTPGTHPQESMIDALQRVSPQRTDLADVLDSEGLEGAFEVVLSDVEACLLVVVDQLEELFVHTDPVRRQQFIDQLVDLGDGASRRVSVVSTLRSDFYDRALQHPGLDRLIRDGQVTVIRPSDDELTEMIRAPAQSVGLRWEPGLPERIASEVSEEPGALPLLQYALTEMVERRSGDLLTMADYRRVGGVAGALANRAETVFASLREDLRSATKTLLLQLVWVDETGDDTRRRVRRSDLESLGINRADLNLILGRLIDERLLQGDYDPVTRGPTVEVAHEALLRNWPRLAKWIDRERDSLILMRRFRAAHREWRDSGESPDYLLKGSRLAPFVDRIEKTSLTSDERDFLERSKLADEREQLARRRRRRVLTSVVGAAAFVALFLAGWAYVERSRADTNAGIARSRELAASAVSVLEEDPELATLLALESIEATPDDVAASASGVLALRQAVAANQLAGRFTPGEGGPTWARISADGSTIYSWSPVEGLAAAIDVDSEAILWTYEEPGGDRGGEYSRLALSPDETLVAIFVFAHAVVEGAEPYIVILSADDGEVVTVLEPGPCPEPEFSREGFTRDGRWLLVYSGLDDCGVNPDADWVTAYDTATWSPEVRLSVVGGAYERVSFSDGGDRVLLAPYNGPTELRSFPDLALISEFGVSSLASLSPDGEKVVRFYATSGPESVGADRRGIVHDASTGRQLFYLDAVDSFWSGDGIIFSPDASNVAITTRDHDYLFDMRNGKLITDLGEAGQTNSAWFTADGQQLLTAMDGSVLLWDLGDPVGTPIGSPDSNLFWINPNRSLNGPRIAVEAVVDDESVGPRNEIQLLGERGEVVKAFAGKGSQLADGRFVANLLEPTEGGLYWGPLVLWDPSMDEAIPLSDCDSPVSRLYENRSPECPAGSMLFGDPRRISSQIISSSDGGYFAAKAYSGIGISAQVVVWDIETLEVRSQFTIPASENLDVAGPDWLAGISSQTGDLAVRDSSTGRLLARSAEAGLEYLELSPDDSVLYGADAQGAVWAFDTSTWESHATWKAHDTNLAGLAVAADGGRLATTGQDDIASVWDVSELRKNDSVAGPPLLDRMSVPFASDAVWLDPDRLGLFLAQGARWLEVSLSVEEVIADARRQLTRSFTPNECATFEIDPCPSLEEMVSG